MGLFVFLSLVTRDKGNLSNACLKCMLMSKWTNHLLQLLKK